MNNSLENYCLSCRQADDHQYPPLADSKPSDVVKMLCDKCRRPVVFIDVEKAAAIVQKHPKTIREWIRRGRVKFLLLADGRYLVCYTSLFRPPLSPSLSDDGLAI